MAETPSLKEGNKPALVAYVFTHAMVVFWIVLGLPFSLSGLKAVSDSAWPKAGGALILTLLVTLMNRLGNEKVKATLVFWRLKHPLPGCRAFSVYASQDSRTDLVRIRQAVGGDLPSDPAEQNRVWYRLYQRFRDSPSVLNPHKEYLLLRDITWMTVLIAAICPTLLLFTRHFKAASCLFAACCVLYLLFRLAAKMAAESFVSTVLACAGAAQDLPQSQILKP